MIREFLSSYRLGYLNAIGLVIFFALFSGMIFWIFRKGGSDFYHQLARMPMDEGSHESSAAHRKA